MKDQYALVNAQKRFRAAKHHRDHLAEYKCRHTQDDADREYAEALGALYETAALAPFQAGKPAVLAS